LLLIAKPAYNSQICHSGLAGIFPEGFPTRFACGNDKNENVLYVDMNKYL